jgi:hypothetical protein
VRERGVKSECIRNGPLSEEKNAHGDDEQVRMGVACRGEIHCLLVSKLGCFVDFLVSLL